MIDRTSALSALMVPVRRIGFLVMPPHMVCRRVDRQARSAQRVVLVSDVSEKFKARFDDAREKQEKHRSPLPWRNS
ncbi:MAG: hypothetical protein K2Y71_13675 [Xanthobacteraceae bacterium]|nr:hypothetical protein [Xanthobacteraceae bacterium]